MEDLNLKLFVGCSECIRNPLCHGGSGICGQNVLYAKQSTDQDWYPVRDRVFQSVLFYRNALAAAGDCTVSCSRWTLVYTRSNCGHHYHRCSAWSGHQQEARKCKGYIPDVVCPIPHNDVENLLWNLETDGKFDVFRYIQKSRNECARDDIGKYFKQKYSGSLQMCCKICLESQCSHESDKILFYFPCPKNKNVKFKILLKSDGKLCEKLKFCGRASCSKYHSFLEKDLTVLKQISGLEFDELINQIENTKCSALSRQPMIPFCKSCKQNVCVSMACLYHCYYCQSFCNSSEQLLEHCNTLEHVLNVHTDGEHPWKYPNSPPGSDDQWNKMYISREESEEQKERTDYKCMKKKIAKELNLESYMDSILDDSERLFCRVLDDIEVTCATDLCQQTNKNEECRWTFTVKPINIPPVTTTHKYNPSKRTNDSLKLLRVALLFHQDRMNFQLKIAGNARKCQFMSFENQQIDWKIIEIEVLFKSAIYGIFKQWILFDFGPNRYLVRQLKVDMSRVKPDCVQLEPTLALKSRSSRIFYATHGVMLFNETCTSCYNEAEIAEIEDVLMQLNSSSGSSRVVVYTSYTAQVSKMRDAFGRHRFSNVAVELIEEMNQNDALDTVIISAVQSSQSAVCETSPEKNAVLFDLNTTQRMLSMTCKRLIVVGDPVALTCLGSCRVTWHEYIVNCSRTGTLFPTNYTERYLHLCCEHYVQFNDSRIQKMYDDSILAPDTILRQLSSQLMPDDEDNSSSYPLSYKFNQFVVLHSESGIDFDQYDDFVTDWEPRVDKSLLDMVKIFPEQYALCRIDIVDKYNINAIVIRDRDKTKRDSFKLMKRGDSKRAFTGDEVVVEYTYDKAKVLGIVREYIDDTERQYICIPDDDRYGSVLPLDRNVPRTCTLIRSTELEEVKKRKCLAVYKIQGGLIEFDHYSDISRSVKPRYIVKYIKWRQNNNYPIGIIIGEIDKTDSFNSGQTALNIQFGIRTRHTREDLNEANRICGHYNIVFSQHLLRGRMDLRGLTVFTIDSEKAEDLDDAISYEGIDSNSRSGALHRIGVHISDVSFFIEKGSCLDREAYCRGQSLYSLKQTDPLIHMIPNKLSTDLFSLLPGEQRLVITHFLEFDANGKQLQVSNPIRAIIKSRAKLSYREANRIIDDHTNSDNVIDSKVSHSLIKLFEVVRLYTKTKDIAKNRKSEFLVQQLMRMVNREVASKLQAHFKNGIPLYITSDKFVVAVRNHRTKNTRAFDSKQKRGSQADRGREHGRSSRGGSTQQTNTDTDENTKSSEIEDTVLIKVTDWKNINEAKCDEHKIKELIGKITPEAKQNKVYACSDETGKSGLELYTQFTSPIRRYFDIIVHRFVVSAFIEQTGLAPYTVEELNDILDHLNLVMFRLEKYEQEKNSLLRALTLLNRSAMSYPIVEQFNETSISFRLPSDPKFPSEIQKVGYNVFGVCKNPHVNRHSKIVTLEWKQRIYHVESPLQSGVRSQRNSTVKLANMAEREYAKVPKFEWDKFLNERSENYLQSIAEINEKYFKKETPLLAEKALSSDQCAFVEFRQTLRTGGLVQVQMTGDIVRGLAQPSLQLLCLAPDLDICIEHQSDSLKCFATQDAEVASRQLYQSISQYRELWQRLLVMNAANSAVAQPSGAIVQGVRMKWYKNGKLTCAKFILDEKFCKERDLSFNPFQTKRLREDIIEKLKNSNMSLWEKFDYIRRLLYYMEKDYDFFCVRYTGKNYDVADNLEVAEDTECVSWVGHCVSTWVYSFEQSVAVYLRLHQSSNSFPEQMLDPNFVEQCTIEWLPRSIPAFRNEDAMLELRNIETSDFVRDIALGSKRPAELSEDDYIVDGSVFDMPDFKPANLNQAIAIQAAVKYDFTLIQGPPGTGKTTTGARLAFHLTKLNRDRSDAGGKVLYCGPTNTSVDLVVHILKKTGNQCPKLLRVYGEDIEKEKFPLPWSKRSPLQSRQKVTELDAELKDVALHYRIRHSSNPHSESVNKYYDSIANKRREDITEEEKESYLRTVLEANWHEMMKADIILVTCSTAGSPRMTIKKRSDTYRSVSNITVDDDGDLSSESELVMKKWQVIIDECSMCTEPETMIPLVKFSDRMEKLVLIGDHKQLEPVVLCREAKRLRLDKSLFECIAMERGGKTVMLTEQYRMHKSICEFPSREFYDGKLRCADGCHEYQLQDSSLKNIWPGGDDTPMVFCHVKGREESQNVRTSDASEMSKWNHEEAEHAIEIAMALIRYHLKDGDNDHETLAILTFYRAQQKEICDLRLRVQDPQRNSVDVSTVVLAQGKEWDYVILSCVRSTTAENIKECPHENDHGYVAWCASNLGFVRNYNQMNVAITRAKRGLIILGNANLLEKDACWRRLLEHFRLKHAYVDIKDFKDKLLHRLIS